MEEFNFDDTEMSTSINQLRKKKSEIDDENNSYTDIRMKLYDEIKSPPISQKNNISNVSHKQHIRLKKNKKQNKNIKNTNKHFYFNHLNSFIPIKYILYIEIKLLKKTELN